MRTICDDEELLAELRDLADDLEFEIGFKHMFKNSSSKDIMATVNKIRELLKKLT
jgi:hypothetical protein